jgi:GntR family transcriptional regulator, phosphonate transport system regulatory protein
MTETRMGPEAGMNDVIARGRGVTVWRQIAESLSADLRSGRIKPGDRLPTELELAERFSVNRHTVRRAVATLAEQGILRIEQGRGTFVNDKTIDYVLGRRTRFSANLLAQGREPGHRLISAERTTVSGTIAADLKLREGAAVMRIETLGIGDGAPMSYGVHEFPLPRFAGIDDAYRRLGSLTSALEEFGVGDYVRKVTRLLARLPSEREAEFLQQTTSRPVLQAEAVNVDAKGKPTHHSLAVFAGDRVQMIVRPEDLLAGG